MRQDGSKIGRPTKGRLQQFHAELNKLQSASGNDESTTTMTLCSRKGEKAETDNLVVVRGAKIKKEEASSPMQMSQSPSDDLLLPFSENSMTEMLMESGSLVDFADGLVSPKKEMMEDGMEEKKEKKKKEKEEVEKRQIVQELVQEKIIKEKGCGGKGKAKEEVGGDGGGVKKATTTNIKGLFPLPLSSKPSFSFSSSSSSTIPTKNVDCKGDSIMTAIKQYYKASKRENLLEFFKLLRSLAMLDKK